MTRLDEFRENLSMPRNTLRERLAKLVSAGGCASRAGARASPDGPRHRLALVPE